MLELLLSPLRISNSTAHFDSYIVSTACQNLMCEQCLCALYNEAR